MNDEPLPTVDSQAAFTAAMRWGFAEAMAARARRIFCMSGAGADWGAWPLEDAALQRQLAGWLRLPQRSLVLLAGSFDEVPRRCPRFTAWRVDWSHVIEAWVAPAESAAALPTLLVADNTVSVQLFDAVHWRGRASRSERDAHRCNEAVDAVLATLAARFPGECARPLGNALGPAYTYGLGAIGISFVPCWSF